MMMNRILHLASPKCMLALACVLALSVAAQAAPNAYSMASATASGRNSQAQALASANSRQGGSASAAATANAGLYGPPRTPARTYLPENTEKLLQQKQAEQMALIKQQYIRDTLASLNELESQETDSIEKCAEWFNLNQRLKQLTGDRTPRAGEIKKKLECDNLYKLISNMRAKLDVFKELVEAENNHLEFVGGLVSSYQELKNLAAENPLLAKELADLEQREPKVALGTERIGQFLQFVDALLNGNKPQEADAEAAASATSEEETDDFKELDRSMRALIDKENELSEDELGQLAELTGLLDRLLSEGHIDYNSGRYRYLTGTLEAGRGIVMHAIAAKNDTQQPEPAPEPQPDPEPKPEPDFALEPVPLPPPEVKPLPLPAFVQPYGGASATAFAHAQSGPVVAKPVPEPEPAEPVTQAPATVPPTEEPPKQEEKSVADQIAENIGQRVNDKLNRFKFAKRGNFAAGYATAGNGAATAGAHAVSAGGLNNNNNFASSLAQLRPSGGFAASNAQAGDNKAGAFASNNNGARGGNSYAASMASSNGAGQNSAAFSQAASGRGGYAGAQSQANGAAGSSAAALAAAGAASH